MFEDPNANPADPATLLQQVLRELDEIKRYSAGSYDKVDNEVDQSMATIKNIEQKIQDLDRRLDRIEAFERRLNEIHDLCRNIERKVN